jgi:hypothetical protein
VENNLQDAAPLTLQASNVTAIGPRKQRLGNRNIKKAIENQTPQVLAGAFAKSLDFARKL